MKRPKQHGHWQAAVWAMVCLTLLACAPSSLAQTGAARVASVSGRVSLDRGSDLWAIQPGSAVQPGQVIVSGPDGYAVLELEDGSKFEVFPDSRIVFRANRGSMRDLLDIFLGRVKIHIQKLGGRPNPYRVNSATALIAVRGTVFEVGVAHDETTTVVVEEGLVGVMHKLVPSKEVFVKGGEALVVHPAEPLTPVSNVSKARIAVRVLSIALDRALQTVRGGGAGQPPVPGAGGGTTPAGGAGGDMGQAPPPPPDVGSDDSGGGSSAPPSSGSGGAGAPPPPPGRP